MKKPSNAYDAPRYYEIAFSFRDIPAEADFLEALIAEHSKVEVETFLELASGNSPHLEELCKRGYRYVGLEMNDEMVAYVQAKIEKKGLPAEIVKGDMTDFSLTSPVDCTLVFLGSHYVKSDLELERHLDAVAKTLRSGGLYVLDGVVRFFPEDVHKQSWEMQEGSIKIVTTYDPALVDEKEGLVASTITLDIEDGTEKKRLEHVETRKIYAFDAFIAQAERSGRWEHVASFSDFDMEKKPKEGGRNILVLRRT